MEDGTRRGRIIMCGICAITPSAAETVQIAPAGGRERFRWDNIAFVRGKCSGGKCWSSNGGCAVRQGLWEYFWGWQQDDSFRGVDVPPTRLW